MSDGLRDGAAGSRAALMGRREHLAAEVQRLRGHLGGLAYEMAIRDHFRLDVLVRRAAILQERESELAEVERLLHAPEAQNGAGAHTRGRR